MKLINKSDLKLSHVVFNKGVMTTYDLDIDKVADVPEEVAKIWLAYPNVEEYISKEDIAKAVKEATAVKNTNKKNVKKAK